MKQIVFTLPAQALGTATGAILLGDFNNWSIDEAIELTPQQDGTWAANVLLQEGKTYEYRFLLNNGQWVNDAAAQNYIHKPEFDAVNSVIAVPAGLFEVPVAKALPKAKVSKAKKVAEPKPKKAAKVDAVAVKDDLTKIEGIGPKIVTLLEADGIISFKDLAKASAKKLKGIIQTAGPKFQMHNPASWPKQAKLAAAQKWDELNILQKELLGGK